MPKTGTGGHLPGNKLFGSIVKVRELEEGKPSVSSSTFESLTSVGDFK